MKNLVALRQYSNGCDLRVTLDLFWVNPKIEDKVKCRYQKEAYLGSREGRFSDVTA